MKTLVRLLSVAAILPLAGCVLAIGNTPDEEGGGVGKRLSALEKRLGALEEKCGACAGGQCMQLGMMNGKSMMKVMKMGEMKVEGKDGKFLVTGQDGKPIVIDLEKCDMGGMVMVEEKADDDDAKEKKAGE